MLTYFSCAYLMFLHVHVACCREQTLLLENVAALSLELGSTQKSVCFILQKMFIFVLKCTMNKETLSKIFCNLYLFVFFHQAIILAL